MKSTLTNNFEASELCTELAALLKKGELREAAVHSVFRTSLNLISGDRLITVLSGSRPLYPYSVRLMGERLPALRPGDRVLLDRKTFRFPGGSVLSLAGAKESALSLKELAENPMETPDTERLRELRTVILHKGKPDGFAPLLFLLEGTEPEFPSNLYADYAAERIPALLEAVRTGNSKESAAAAYSIAGCGIGLTPSADDFLTGLMASLFTEAVRRKETARLSPLLHAMAEAAAPRTNTISGTFLKEAADGLVSADVREFFRDFYTCVLSQGITPSAMNVIAFGETSGTDILTGIYFGQKIYPNLGGNGIG